MKTMKMSSKAILAIFLLLLNPILSYTEQGNGSVQIFIKYQSILEQSTVESRLNIANVVLKIYQDFGTNVFKEISPLPSNPYTITALPIGHEYKIEVYVNSIYAGVGFVKLEKSQQNMDIITTGSGGMHLTVYYNDGATPIANATVAIKTSDGKTWTRDTTDSLGQTERIWLQASTRPNDNYRAEISLGPNLLYIHSPITLTQDVSQEIKVVTKWPSKVDNLVTVQVYKSPTTRVEPSDGNFAVVIYDSKKNKIAESDVNSKGFAYFSEMKVNNYHFGVIKKDDSVSSPKILSSKKSTITGSQDTIKMYLNNPELNMDNFDCNCVAFRLDDIQDYFLNNVQTELIRYFEGENASLTVGIIGGAFGGDQKLVTLLRDRAETNNPPLEIASHGWNNLLMTQMTKNEQTDLLQKSVQKISQSLGITPTVFIPPENAFNNDTLSILQSNGFTHISYHIDVKEPPPFKKSGLHHFPAVTETARLGDPHNLVWTPNSNQKIIEKIQNGIFNYGYAVVMVHPYEFATYNNGFFDNKVNQAQFQKLGDLIDQIRANGIQIVTIGRIDTYDKPVIINTQPPPKENTGKDCNCVAFRLDNVQDFYLNDVQGEIINTFQKRNADLTLGILGKVIGTDLKTVNLIKEKLNSTDSTISLANRGWEHLDHSQYTKDEQSASIKKTNDVISQVFGVAPSIFAPPFNMFNDDTLLAMKENKMKYLSSSSTIDTPPYDLRASLVHLPQTSTILDLGDDPFLTGTINEKSLSKIKSQIKQYGFSVISLQPQNFAIKEDVYVNQVDSKKIQELDSLLSYIQSKGIKIVTLDKIPQTAATKGSQDWILKLYDWQKSGKITKYELGNAIKWLIAKKILESEPII